MKKSLLALAALGAFAGAASAQSSVTVYGMFDIAAMKQIGSANKTIANENNNSQLGFKGTEDLGGGLRANFDMQHRFNPESGQANNPSVFWTARSIVGLSGDFGAVDIGRDYTVNFLMVQNTIDPFATHTIAIARDIGMRAGSASVVRYSSQAEYHFGANGFNLGAQVADNSTYNTVTGQGESAAAAGSKAKAYSLAANYGMGPLYVAAGYQRDSDERKVWDIGAKYNFGVLSLSAGYSDSKLVSVENKGWLVGVLVPVGAGNIRAVYDTYKSANVVQAKRFGVGYDYSLSKRTSLFATVARDSVPVTQKTGYDLGILHTF